METKYLIKKIETCPVCKGEKILYNQDWQEINLGNAVWMNANGIATFNEAAHADWERRIKETWGNRENAPPEEEPCPECEGEGKLETWVPLQQALFELGYYRPTDWDVKAERFVLHM